MGKKEIKSSLGITNMNGITSDDDRSCALNDMNCLEGQEGQGFSLTDMNAAAKDEDTSCSLNDMNCQGG
ncbi:MAG: hypothetical protein HDT38_00210 [Clostridiales bacterium]|nr:hypothetical protein [Clostridiales bacterium]